MVKKENLRAGGAGISEEGQMEGWGGGGGGGR